MSFLADPINPATPERPRLGLIASAQGPEPGELLTLGEHWPLGVHFRTELCSGSVGAFRLCDEGTQSVHKGTGTRSTIVEEEPIGIYAVETASTAGNLPWEEHVARALRKLDLWESWILEREFWLGGAGTSNFKLAAAGGVTIIPAPAGLKVHEGIAVMDKALGDCLHGVRGMIHVTRLVADLAMNNAGAYRSGNLLLTHAADTVIVPGSGYPGTGPAGEDESLLGNEWIYGTAMAKVLRGPPTTIPEAPAGAVLRTTDDLTVVAEKPAVVIVDPCCLLAIKVGLPPY